jgi:hypothetical protein
LIKPHPVASPEPVHRIEPAAKTEPVVKPVIKPESTRPEPAKVAEPVANLTPSVPSSGSASAPTLTSEIERVKLNWKQILDEVPSGIKKTAAVSWLRGGRPVSIVGETISIAFAFEIHKSNVEKPENMKVVEKIFNEYLGHNCKVVCILDNKKDHLVNLAKKMGAEVTSVEEK